MNAAKTTLVLMGLSGLLAFSSVTEAHQSGHSRSAGGLAGKITIWAGGPHGGGYSGILHYGPGPAAYGPVIVRHPGAQYYSGCDHWHDRGYRPDQRHYRKYGRDHGHHGYEHGYAKGYNKGKGHRKHGYDRGHDRYRSHGWGYGH